MVRTAQLGSLDLSQRPCSSILSLKLQRLARPAVVRTSSADKTTSMRALVRAAHRRHGGTALVLAPTGKAVDVAVREGAGDEGYTIAKALQLLRDNRLELGPQTLVIVDEAAMVGTNDLVNYSPPPTQPEPGRSP
jgi:AAA domain